MLGLLSLPGARRWFCLPNPAESDIMEGVKIVHGGHLYTTDISKRYKSGLFSSPTDCFQTGIAQPGRRTVLCKEHIEAET